jgi:hypothetical protein
MPLADQLKQTGYAEIDDATYNAAMFDSLYESFDMLIEFLRQNPAWAHKLYRAKERFIRSSDRHIYSTDFFGLYDESHNDSRCQISFYYSLHFHAFIVARYPEFNKITAFIRFFEICRKIQDPCGELCAYAARELGVDSIFASTFGMPPILLKVIKYFPSYFPKRSHYDGTAFSFFLDSTDNQSLLLSPYKSSFARDDFSPALRAYSRSDHRHSILLIPGIFLTEFAIYPTPHIVMSSGQARYATIAFAMRPHYCAPKILLAPLPSFRS